MPVALARPRDVLAGHDGLARLDDGVDVPVPEVAGVNGAADAARSREEDGPALDREDPVRAPRRRAALRPVVADGDVDAVVVDRAALRIRPRVEERAANRVLPLLGRTGQPRKVSL